MIFHYTCDKSECTTLAAAAAGFKDSDLGRCYISLLEPLCRASMFGKKHENRNKMIQLKKYKSKND